MKKQYKPYAVLLLAALLGAVILWLMLRPGNKTEVASTKRTRAQEQTEKRTPHGGAHSSKEEEKKDSFDVKKGESYSLAVGEKKTIRLEKRLPGCVWSSSAKEVASVSQGGSVEALKEGKTTILCKSGNIIFSFDVEVSASRDIVTPRNDLPETTRADSINVTVNSSPDNRTYAIYKQNGKGNKSKKFPRYMPGHGCSASSLGCVLSAYAGFQEKPYHLVEQVERQYFGEAWEKNYSKSDADDSKSRPMPVSLYGMTKILDGYGVRHRYVRSFNDQEAEKEIGDHLKTGNPVLFIVSAKNRFGVGPKNKWTTGYHCMTMLGMTDGDEVIVADTVDRSKDIFGDNQRIKYAPLHELIGYMFSCENVTSTSVYWNGKASSGGYILINPREN